MQVIPLFKNEEEKELRNRIKNMEVSIPSEWWDTNYSFNYTANENKPVFEINKRELKKLPVTPEWNIRKGDYRVQESRVNTHDYVYYRDLKIKLLKYSVYPVLLLTMLLILKLSDVLSKI